jgi:hypothetical protein
LSISFIDGSPCTSPEGWTIGPLATAVQRHRLTPSTWSWSSSILYAQDN